MKVTSKDIQQAFLDLESGAKSREEISEFASAAMRADDDSSLSMEPENDTERIWRAIRYLSGVDLKESPETYLFCVEDFVDFRKEAGIELP